MHAVMPSKMQVNLQVCAQTRARGRVKVHMQMCWYTYCKCRRIRLCNSFLLFGNEQNRSDPVLRQFQTKLQRIQMLLLPRSLRKSLIHYDFTLYCCVVLFILVEFDLASGSCNASDLASWSLQLHLTFE